MPARFVRSTLSAVSFSISLAISEIHNSVHKYLAYYGEGQRTCPEAKISQLLAIGGRFSACGEKGRRGTNKPVGGGSGIRTHDTVSRIHAFQACALSHSAIPPRACGTQYSLAPSSDKPAHRPLPRRWNRFRPRGPLPTLCA